MKTWSSIALPIIIGLFFTKASAQSPEPFKLALIRQYLHSMSNGRRRVRPEAVGT
jgi:hypothetical protein